MLKFAESEEAEKLKKAEIHVVVDEIKQIGDVVIDRTRLTMKVENFETSGWSLTIWIKEDGQWKIRNTCTTFRAPKPDCQK
ncbi:unnamed protein product [Caenorhabditis bovis]|uniref:DUF4440 domain-containing protein n=1 Tax=Caenorhabditis bovis TaxID=2654633 RepID=A0A8S1F3E6_9PELO|nr:unnamed protein product [Caenorhabditis bovis]